MKKYTNLEFRKIVFKNKRWVNEILSEYNSNTERLDVICRNGHTVNVATKDLARKSRMPKCPKCRIETRDEYEASPKLCLHCNQPIAFDTTSKYTRSKTFCSSSCFAKHNNVKRKKVTPIRKYDKCANPECSNDVKRKGQKYCSLQCQADSRYHAFVSDWKDGIIVNRSEQISGYIKKYLLKKFDNSCTECGLSKNNPHTGLSILQVHHIDGDHKNNSEGNLTLLCPNCHSLTENFGARNRGKGRLSRRKKGA